MIRKVVCLLIAALLTSGLAAPALSQSVSDEFERERLACLTDDAALLPKLPPLSADDRRRARLRLQLEFTRPDAAPTVKTLRASGDADFQERVLRYVSSYRLPCLRANDRPILAIQEFDLAAQRGVPIPTPSLAPEDVCLSPVGPPPMRPDLLSEGQGVLPSMALRVQLRFYGDGSNPPEVSVLASNATPRLQRQFINHLKTYRLACRKTGDPDLIVSQGFQISFSDSRSPWPREKVPLGDFLGMVDGIENINSYFDLNSMGCPFELDFTLWQPAMKRNEIADPNRKSNPFSMDRVPLRDWLASLPIKIGKPSASEHLLGTGFKISVPCGVLDLSPTT